MNTFAPPQPTADLDLQTPPPGTSFRSDADADADAGRTPPITVRCSTTQDFLAVLPHLTGLTADDSLTIVLFAEKQAFATARLDLPDPGDAPAIVSLLDAVLAVIEESGAGPQRPAIVIRTSETFSAAGGPPWKSLTRPLERRLRRRGWFLREYAIIAADGWTSLLDPRAPRLGRPLDEITQNPIERELLAHDGPPLPVERLGRLPEPDAARVAAVHACLAELDSRGERESGDPVAATLQVHGAVRILDACLEVHPASEPPCGLRLDSWEEGRMRASQIDPKLCARLIRATEREDGWLAMVLTTLTRGAFVVDAFDESVSAGLAAHAQRSTTEAGAFFRRGEQPGAFLTSMLIDLAAFPPPVLRVLEAQAVFAEVAACAPPARRAGLLAILAWGWWVLGLSSAAGRVADAGVSSHDDDPRLRTVTSLLSRPAGWRLDQIRDRLAAPATGDRG